MQEKLFHDRSQSMRVFIIDFIIYNAMYCLLIFDGYTHATVFFVFHGSLFHVTIFMMDAFGSVLLDGVLSGRRAKKAKAEGNHAPIAEASTEH